MHYIKLCFYWIFTWPHIICYLLTCQEQKKRLKKDIERALELRRKTVSKCFIWTLYNWIVAAKSNRDIFYMRIGQLSKLLKWYLPGELLCGIYSTKRNFIGGGLIIQHGWSMVLDAASVGENLWINQGVTVGYKGNGHPTIGNNVRIGTNAVVLGEITIGDNVNIGAGAVVVKDVPSNTTVVSPHAYICKRDGKRVHEEL